MHKPVLGHDLCDCHAEKTQCKHNWDFRESYCENRLQPREASLGSAGVWPASELVFFTSLHPFCCYLSFILQSQKECFRVSLYSLKLFFFPVEVCIFYYLEFSESLILNFGMDNSLCP